VQLAEIEFDDETYEPLAVYKPAATRKQIEKALDMLNAAERPLIVAGGGVINADCTPAFSWPSPRSSMFRWCPR